MLQKLAMQNNEDKFETPDQTVFIKQFLLMDV